MSEETETFGGDSAESISCPNCDAPNCQTDAQIDGVLEPGYKFECTNCGQEVEITTIDWTPDIWVKLAARPTAGGKS